MKSTQSKRICIVTQSHLCRNPRVVKEATALADAGYQVTIINNTYSSALRREDEQLVDPQDIKTVSIARLESADFFSFSYRLFKRSGDWLMRYFGLQTPYALGYASWRYKAIALEQNADLYICHQELGLYCGVQLLGSKKKVAFDFEDWYSEDLLEQARKSRPIKLLKKLEGIALREGTFCFTTSDAMANKLAETYHSNIPETIYNSFAADEGILSKPKMFTPPLKLFWFSQTIGAGRGLEAFLDLISKINFKLEVHLLGNVDETYKSKLSLIQGNHPVFFHALVAANKLSEKIACFDIGLALEINHPANRNFTVTNKLFQYILSGLPVIATNTTGQQEIINKYGGGLLIDFNEPLKSINDLEKLFNDKSQLQYLRQQAVDAAVKLCWQNEKTKLLSKVQQAV